MDFRGSQDAKVQDTYPAEGYRPHNDLWLPGIMHRKFQRPHHRHVHFASQLPGERRGDGHPSRWNRQDQHIFAVRIVGQKTRQQPSPFVPVFESLRHYYSNPCSFRRTADAGSVPINASNSRIFIRAALANKTKSISARMAASRMLPIMLHSQTRFSDRTWVV